MLTIKSLKRNLRQTGALIERNLFLNLRYKTAFFTRLLNPIIQILMPLIIFGAFFAINENFAFGYWTSENFILFMLIAFCIQFMRQIIDNFHNLMMREKFWKTFEALMVAPMHRFNLLLATLISELIIVSFIFMIFFIFALILFPIPIFYVLLILGMFAAISLVFASIGLIVGILAITKEGSYRAILVGVRFLFWLSCVSYPLMIFPGPIRFFILLNPLYYFFDTLRLLWLMGVDYEFAVQFLTPVHIIVVLTFTIMTPIVSIYLFDIFYKKYGITGY